jgi:hypothetical protein
MLMYAQIQIYLLSVIDSISGYFRDEASSLMVSCTAWQTRDLLSRTYMDVPAATKLKREEEEENDP